MRLVDHPFLSPQITRIRCEAPPAGWREGAPVLVHLQDDACLIRQGDRAVSGEVLAHSGRFALQAGDGRTLWLLRRRRKEIFDLQALEISEIHRLDLAIAVDEAVVEDLARRGEIPTQDPGQACLWLKARFLLEEEEGDSSASRAERLFLGRFQGEADRGFSILGAGWRGRVIRKDEAYRLESLTRLTRSEDPIRMAQGRIAFHDATLGAVLKEPEHLDRLETALNGSEGYLRLWRAYGDLEKEQAVSRIRQLGALAFSGTWLQGGEDRAWALKVEGDEAREFLKRWRSVGFAEDELLTIETAAPDFLDDDAALAQRRESDWKGRLEILPDGVALWRPDENRTQDAPPFKGFVLGSLAGSKSVGKRREAAWSSIKSGRRFPQLRYLLEGVDVPIPPRRRHEALSPGVKACFRGPLTDRQRDALDVAVNTPDVALIVGPPGTGKTQVIAALQRRFAEIPEGLSIQHRLLVSSHQHDALLNALQRSEVFGLPPIRIGGKMGKAEGGVDPVDLWRKERARRAAQNLEALRAANPWAQPLAQIEQESLSLKLSSLSAAERQAGFDRIDRILRELQAAGFPLALQSQQDWRDFLRRKATARNSFLRSRDKGLMRAVRRLRTTPVGYADDGQEAIRRLAEGLQAARFPLEEGEQELLEHLSGMKEPGAEDLRRLEDLQNAMIDRLMPDDRPLQIQRTTPGEDLDALEKLALGIEQALGRGRQSAAAILAAYHEALVYAPEETEKTVRDYANVVGATCQQAASRAMGDLKNLVDANASEMISFDTVIVDEAARANPLDLFVPMAMANRRIVLVGDHRQLPHLMQRNLEEELVSRMNLQEAQKKAYEESLFERLLRDLSAREARDGVRRVVMLDTQYRMHPALGDFISKQFYESEGLSPLRSGRPAEDFRHEIPGYQGRCAAWLDVPRGEGEEKRVGTSWTRRAEAEAVAQEARKILEAGGPSLSVGIITFYSPQRPLILQALAREGLAGEEDGDLRILPAFRQTTSGEERLRVGTVDAFQGKEFDVVLLSVVRSRAARLPTSVSEEEREAFLNGKYGHLRLSNRMNVAMSRQRKLLIVAGDRLMAEGPEAEAATPALAAFSKFCRERGAHG